MTTLRGVRAQFVGVIEHLAAEVMQQYAALYPHGRPDRPKSVASNLMPQSPKSSMASTPFGMGTPMGRSRAAMKSVALDDAKFMPGSFGPRCVRRYGQRHCREGSRPVSVVAAAVCAARRRATCGSTCSRPCCAWRCWRSATMWTTETSRCRERR
jgi:hypothetical protein